MQRKPEQGENASNSLEARKKAMGYLARREYGQRELTQKLGHAGFDHDTAASAVLQLNEDGLQDDRRFVENFVQSRVSQGKGPVRIYADLSQRGIAGDLVDDVLEDLSVDWFELVREVREKKFGCGLPAGFREKAKQMRFLQYRGFEQGHLQAAFSDLE